MLNFLFLGYLFHNPTHRPEAAIHGCSAKGCFEKFHKNQRKTPVPGLSVLIKLQALGLQLVKKGLQQRFFFVKFAKFFERVFFTEQLWKSRKILIKIF